MSTPLLIAMPGSEAFAERLAGAGSFESATIACREFPDKETYLTLPPHLAGRSVVFVETLADPNPKYLPLMFAVETARELGATRVGLVAPYLAYMRQDARFAPGEAVTSKYFAKELSRHFDWLVTVDPHLHRYKALGEIYSIPTSVVHAAPAISRWIADQVEKPFIIGPDRESEQWVSQVASDSGAPVATLDKMRSGDRSVRVLFPQAGRVAGYTPVIVDDIVSTGNTMLEAVKIVRQHSGRTPICIAVHGLFAEGADERLEREGARVVSCNSVAHRTNGIDIAPLVARAILTLG